MQRCIKKLYYFNSVNRSPMCSSKMLQCYILIITFYRYITKNRHVIGMPSFYRNNAVTLPLRVEQRIFNKMSFTAKKCTDSFPLSISMFTVSMECGRYSQAANAFYIGINYWDGSLCEPYLCALSVHPPFYVAFFGPNILTHIIYEFLCKWRPACSGIDAQHAFLWPAKKMNLVGNNRGWWKQK